MQLLNWMAMAMVSTTLGGDGTVDRSPARAAQDPGTAPQVQTATFAVG